MSLRKNVVAASLALLGIQGLLSACGGDEETGTGFVVIAKVRGINYFAIHQLQVRFEAAGEGRFDGGCGGEPDIECDTEDDGRVFTATGNQRWVQNNRILAGSEFTFTMPFVNPDGGGDVNMQVVIDREINGAMVRVGESARTPAILPAAAGEELEIVVGCIENGECSAEVRGDEE